MKKGIQILFTFFSLMLISCSSDNDATNTNNNNPTSGFVWRENFIDAPLNNANSAYFTVAFNTLIAKDANNITLFELNLTGATPATYPINNTPVFFTYTGINPIFVATGGQVVITSNANGKLSGTFEAFKTGTGLTRIYGSFTEIPIQ